MKLSSRRLLIFVEHLPEDAAFPLAWTDDWPYAKQLQAGMLNELRIMRSENAVFNGNDYREPQLIKTPRQILAEQYDAEEKQKIRTGIMAQLQGV